MKTREYMRILPERLAELKAEGWRLVAASTFAGAEIAVLVVREAAAASRAAPPAEQLESGGGSP